MNSIINENSIGHLLSLSTWGSFLAFLFVAIATIIIIVLYKKKKEFVIPVAFAIGILGMIIFGIIYNYNNPVNIPGIEDGSITWVDEAKDWFSLYTILFFSGLILIIPIYVFTSIVLLLINSNKKIGKKTFLVSISMLILLPIFGAIIGLLMVPLINLIDPNLMDGIGIGEIPAEGEAITIPGFIASGMASSVSMLFNVETIITMVVFSIIMAFVFLSIKKTNTKSFDSILNFFLILKEIVAKYISFILVLLPFAISTRLAMLFMNSAPENGLKVILFWFAIYMIGFIIIFITITVLIKLLSNKNVKTSNVLFKHSVNAIGSGSVFATLPSTIHTSIELGSNYEIANMTPVKGAFMGKVMCGGFTPMIILLFSAHFESDITIQIMIISLIVVVLLSIGTSGMGHADFMIVISGLSTLGLSTATYSLIFTIIPITEILSVINNTNGHILSTLVTSKVFEKTNEDKEYINKIPIEQRNEDCKKYENK